MTDIPDQDDSNRRTGQAAGTEAEQPITPLVYPAKSERKSRRFRSADDIDTEYAEEFEDAFYGEGM